MEHQFGGFWRRVIAFFIDRIILIFILCMLFFVGLLALWFGFPSQYKELLPEGVFDLGIKFMFFYSFVAVLTHMLYFTYFHGTTGQTPGKMIFGLRVLQSTGESMTLGIGFLRWAGYFVSAVFFCMGFLWIAFDRKKQGWHDKIAGTVVICTMSIEDAPSGLVDEKYLDKDREIL